jgi:hypothetical protein
MFCYFSLHVPYRFELSPSVVLSTLFISCRLTVFIYWSGTAVAQWLRCCATNRKVPGSIPAGVSEFFIDIKSFRSDSTSNRNEYQEYFLGVKVAGADNLPPSCAVVTKSGYLNFLEPSGPLQACNGTALPFYTLVLSSLNCTGNSTRHAVNA